MMGLTRKVFIEQRLSASCSLMGIEHVRHSEMMPQGIQPNSGRSQGVQQQPASNLTGQRARNSPEGQPSP